MVENKVKNASKKMVPKKEKKFIIGRNPHSFSKMYATNVLVNATDVDVRLNFMNEILDGDEEKVAICDGLIILHPQAAALLLEQLSEAMVSFEGKEVAHVNEARRSLIRSLKKEKNPFSDE